MSDFKSPIPYFLQQVLKNPGTSIPRGAQWIVAFDDLQSKILPSINLALQYEPNTWNTDGAAQHLVSKAYQEDKGCLFAQAISLPGESMTANAAGNIVSNAFIRPYVGAGRDPFHIIRMSFLETITSFADNVLRPWTIATQNFGMVAWPEGDPKNYRTNLHCYKFANTSAGLKPVMEVIFYGICCISVGDEEFNYNPNTAVMVRDAQFVYQNYAINPTTDHSASAGLIPTIPSPNMAQSGPATQANMQSVATTV